MIKKSILRGQISMEINEIDKKDTQSILEIKKEEKNAKNFFY